MAPALLPRRATYPIAAPPGKRLQAAVIVPHLCPDYPNGYSGMIFALVTACGLGAITTLAKVFYADGGDAITLMLVRLLVSTLAFGFLLHCGVTASRSRPDTSPALAHARSVLVRWNDLLPRARSRPSR